MTHEFMMDNDKVGNIDVTKINKYTVSNEEYVVEWFNEHGFTGKVIKYNTRGMELIVEKNGIADNFKLTATMCNPKKCDIKLYMEQFAKSFEMKCEIERMKKERNIIKK